LFDPCPYPPPPGFNGLDIAFEEWNLVNCWFNPDDIENVGDERVGPTELVKKAISEFKQHGRNSLVLLPTPAANPKGYAAHWA
jgi:hypothetical protein